MNFDGNTLWRERSSDNKAQVTLSFYERSASLTVFSTDNSVRKPLSKIPLNMSSAIHIADILKQLKKSEGPMRLMFIPQLWDRNARKFNNGDAISFFKNERNCYGFDIVPKDKDAIRFIIKAQGAFTDGSEPMSEEKRSSIGLDVLIHVFAVQFGIASLLVRFNPVTQYSRGGNGDSSGSSSNNRSSSNSNEDIWG